MELAPLQNLPQRAVRQTQQQVGAVGEINSAGRRVSWREKADADVETLATVGESVAVIGIATGDVWYPATVLRLRERPAL